MGRNSSKNRIRENDYFINCLAEIFYFDLTRGLKISNDYYIHKINNIHYLLY